MTAVRAFHFRFFADAQRPLIAAYGRVPGFASSLALEPSRIDIFTAAEKRAKQVDLLRGRRSLVHIHIELPIRVRTVSQSLQHTSPQDRIATRRKTSASGS